MAVLGAYALWYFLLVVHYYVLPQPTTCPANKDSNTENLVAELKTALENGLGEITRKIDELATRIEELQEETRNLSKPNDGLLSDTVRKTCSEWRNSGFNGSGCYLLDPGGNYQGERAFMAYCDMVSKDGIGVTVFHHDHENRTKIQDNERCSPAFCYKRKIRYKNTNANIISLINVSGKCEQFIRYDCYHSVLNQNGAWYTRDGTRATYWAGGTPGDKYCACGVAGTCADCNCDANDNHWRSDEGILTLKNDLPVTAVSFGDTDGSNEEGIWSLGELMCYG